MSHERTSSPPDFPSGGQDHPRQHRNHRGCPSLLRLARPVQRGAIRVAREHGDGVGRRERPYPRALGGCLQWVGRRLRLHQKRCDQPAVRDACLECAEPYQEVCWFSRLTAPLPTSILGRVCASGTRLCCAAKASEGDARPDIHRGSLVYCFGRVHRYPHGISDSSSTSS